MKTKISTLTAINFPKLRLHENWKALALLGFFWIFSAQANEQLAYRFAGVNIPKPLPEMDVREVHWGVSVSDPYRFLENVKDPAVVQWMQLQAQASDSILKKIPGRQSLLERFSAMDEAAGDSLSGITRTAGDRWFYLKRGRTQTQATLMWRDGIQGSEHLLLDPQAIAKKGALPHAIQSFHPSPDGKLMAYGLHASGSEIGSLYLVEVATGKEVIPPIDRIRFASVAWLNDGSGFFFSRLRPGYESMKATERFADTGRYFLDLSSPDPQRLIFNASRHPELQLPPYASGYLRELPGTELIALVVSYGVDRRLSLHVAPKNEVMRGQAKWRTIFDLSHEVREVHIAHGNLYLRSALNAPRFKVLRLPLSALDMQQAQVLLPETDGVIRAIDAGQDGLYITRREGVNSVLLKISTQHLTNSTTNPSSAQVPVISITLPFTGNVTMNASLDHKGLLVNLSGWTQAIERHIYDPDSGKFYRLNWVAPNFIDEKITTVSREVMLPSHDGVMVPLSIISRKDVVLNGKNPTLLYGYGAYGTTEEPSRSLAARAWVERGGIYAIAHVRGGGAFGSQWHDAGRKTTKHNTWKDGIAAAQWLIANGYTSPAKLGVYGGSAGGIFIGRAITERPDLFAVAVPSVPVLDMVRSEQRANGVANIPEYGSVKIEEEFHALLRSSAYHAVRDGVRYPATLLMHGVNDSRVDVWQSLKFASRLSTAQQGQQPVLLRLDYQAGHGAGSSPQQGHLRSADMLSFMLWQMGEAGFQPSD